MKRVVLLLFLLCLIGLPCAYAASSKADLVLRNGLVYTMDAPRSWAESIAIQSGKIVYVGPDSGIEPWIGPSTTTIQLGGHFVLPGFIDGHVHPISAGIDMDKCDLNDMDTKEKVLQAIKECAESKPDAEWIIGTNWQLPVFPNANPQKEWLDAIVPNRPVVMTAADGHSSWVNSKALEMAGITKDTPDPQNGRIERNAQGEPSGTLRESATDLVDNITPKPTLGDYIIGLQRALHQMNSFGITGFNDADVSTPTPDGSVSYLDVYREADKRGILTARVIASMYANPKGSMDQVLQQVEKFKKLRAEYEGKNFRATAIKIFEDGVIEANTAAMLMPYLDNTNDAGTLNWEPEKLNPFVEMLDKEKFQIHFHAIGDKAVRVALTSLESAQKANGIRDARPMIAHLEVIDPNDIPRFASLNVVPVFQPLWAYEDDYIKDLTIPKLGAERSRWIYPMHSVLVTGATMAMGSDWNVSSVNPLDGIEVAVTRQDPEGATASDKPFIPEERIALRDALSAYTIGSAFVTFRDKETGSIEPGKLADIIVLSEDLFTIPPSQISEVKVLLTLLGGKEIYRDPLWNREQSQDKNQK
jgi:predicted amidohydrolase YtcJ